MILFKRRDTRFWVLGLGGFAALLPLTAGLGTSAFHPAVQLPLSALVFAAVAAGILRWRRALPPDVPLDPVDPARAAELLAAPPPPGATRVFLAFERDWPRRYRLDVLVDGRHAGQLLPGTGTLLLLPPGLHTLSVFLDRPRTTVSETVNAIPGGDAGFRVRNHGSRAIELAIRRIPPGSLAARGAEVRLLRSALFAAAD